jgi:hypothetical protein
VEARAEVAGWTSRVVGAVVRDAGVAEGPRPQKGRHAGFESRLPHARFKHVEGDLKSMAGHLNSVTLMGNVGRDPELKHTPSGVAICSFSLATNKRFKKQGSDEYEDKTTWHNVVIWRERAETAYRLLKKGSVS